jgi:NAD(P)-dependent dehydrogenase (short-subunit alcohol dehydrogenase family)
LAGKIVVITGAGSGIGRASAQLFAREGAQLVCADIRRPWVDDTVGMILDAGGSAVAVTCDVTQTDDVAAAVQAAVTSFGKLDVMFNNAGVASPRRGMLLEDHTDDDFTRLVAVNARGVFVGCREAVRQFKRQGNGGVIVNTGSIAGMVGMGSVVYGATKAFVIQLTRALGAETASAGIRVNCICPGGMVTNFGRPESEAFRELTEEETAGAAAMHPMGQLITPDDCASAALYLASDLSANVTGIALPVDGGYLAR